VGRQVVGLNPKETAPLSGAEMDLSLVDGDSLGPTLVSQRHQNDDDLESRDPQRHQFGSDGGAGHPVYPETECLDTVGDLKVREDEDADSKSLPSLIWILNIVWFAHLDLEQRRRWQ
jgi:hypothetical protein